MKCELCGKKEAQLKIQQFIGSEMSELNICENCAEERGIISSENGYNMSLTELLTVLVDTKGNKDRGAVRSACPKCGMKPGEIRKRGMVGCAECYVSFRNEIASILSKAPVKPKHRGKYPARVQVYKTFFVDREKLREKLDHAVKSEEYEKAARIRDRLNELDGYSEDKHG